MFRNFPVGGGLILILFVFISLFAPVLTDQSPVEQNLGKTLLPPSWSTGGSPDHILGTDNLGRDVMSRLLHGARVSLMVGIFSVILSLVFGSCMGLFAGFFGGKTDNLIMRIADMQLSLPPIIMAIAIIGALGPNIRNIIIVMAIANWPSFARLTRGEVLSVKQNEYVEMAVVSGARVPRVLFFHILPNVINTVIVMATLSLGQLIMVEGALSFVGLGVQPPTPSWGSMLSDGRAYLSTSWHLATFPGLAIMLVVLGTNLFGDWLRDYLDPKRKKHL